MYIKLIFNWIYFNPYNNNLYFNQINQNTINRLKITNKNNLTILNFNALNFSDIQCLYFIFNEQIKILALVLLKNFFFQIQYFFV